MQLQQNGLEITGKELHYAKKGKNIYLVSYENEPGSQSE